MADCKHDHSHKGHDHSHDHKHALAHDADHGSSHSHDDHHGHDHQHGGLLHHHHQGESVGRMQFAFFLNIGFAIFELFGGYWTNSIAITSDAIHDFGDAFALLMAIILEKISHRKSDPNFSYGYRRFSVLGAVITGSVLSVGSLIVLVKAIPRLMNPEQPHVDGMIAMAVFGVIVNGAAAYRVSKGVSLNERMIMWHMMEDVMGWILVLIGAVVMKFFYLPQIDAALGILLAVWILYNVFRNLKEAVKVFLMALPTAVQISEVEKKVRAVSAVMGVHHSHLWSLDGEQHVYTGHIVISHETSSSEMDRIKSDIKGGLRSFGIIEATLELEFDTTNCADPQHKS